MDLDGKKLEVTVGSWSEARGLMKAIERAFKKGGVKLDTINLSGLSTVTETTELGGVFDAIVGLYTSIDSDDDVEAALLECAKRARLGNDKISSEFFDKPENRKYYIPIMVEVIKVNLSPFFEGLVSALSGLGMSLPSTLTQK